MTIDANRDIKAGEEITIDYVKKQNEQVKPEERAKHLA